MRSSSACGHAFIWSTFAMVALVFVSSGLGQLWVNNLAQVSYTQPHTHIRGVAFVFLLNTNFAGFPC